MSKLVSIEQKKIQYQNNLPIGISNYSQRYFRPIHYLGSKLRVLDLIKKTIDTSDPSMGRVLDLFSGSGTVSNFLSRERPISSVDIQEYSKVLFSALLNPCKGNCKINEFIQKSRKSDHYETLLWCFEPLINYEAKCLTEAIGGIREPLCEIVENGSMYKFEKDPNNEISDTFQDRLSEVIDRLISHNIESGQDAMIVRYFGGVYFSYLQSVQIDCLLNQIFKFKNNKKNTYLAALLSTASQIVNTIGNQFAQPLNPRNSKGEIKKNFVNKVRKDRTCDVFSVYSKWLRKFLLQPNPLFSNYFYKMDYASALDKLYNENHRISSIYADPPYTRDHYSRYYHVLETMCLRDNPDISTNNISGKTVLSKGIYREKRHQSPFCIKSKVSNAFNVLFNKAINFDAPLLVSYSPYDKNAKARPRLLTTDQLSDIANKYYDTVEIISVGNISHSKLNNNEKNFDVNYNAEILISCKNK